MPRNEAPIEGIGAPGSEFEITPQMIEAGMEICDHYGVDVGSVDELVRQIILSAVQIYIHHSGRDRALFSSVQPELKKT